MRMVRLPAACLLLLGFIIPNARAELPGKWQSRAPMPSARTEVAAVEVGGKIFVIGGYDKGGHLVEEYDPAKDNWRARASLPKPLHHVGAAAVNGKIYVIGGYISGVGPVDTVYEYDPVSGSLEREKSHADGARRFGRRYRSTEKSTPSAASAPTAKTPTPTKLMIPRKTAGPSTRRLPTPRDHHAVGVVNGKLYAIAGRINGNHDRSIGDNEEYDPASDRWHVALADPNVRSGIVAAVLTGKVFVFGGEYNRAHAQRRRILRSGE